MITKDQKNYEKVQQSKKKSRIKHYPKRHYGTYIHSAKKRKLSFDLDFNVFLELCSKICYYCGSINGKLNGLDRVDSTKGYTLDNIVSCCSLCNYAKKSLSQQEFFYLIKNIYEKHSLQGILQ